MLGYLLSLSVLVLGTGNIWSETDLCRKVLFLLFQGQCQKFKMISPFTLEVKTDVCELTDFS